MTSLLALALASSVTFAAPPAQNHHCLKDGQTVEMTKKACKKAGGTWEKNTATKDSVAAPDQKPATEEKAAAPGTAP